MENTESTELRTNAIALWPINRLREVSKSLITIKLSFANGKVTTNGFFNQAFIDDLIEIIEVCIALKLNATDGIDITALKEDNRKTLLDITALKEDYRKTLLEKDNQILQLRDALGENINPGLDKFKLVKGFIDLLDNK